MFVSDKGLSIVKCLLVRPEAWRNDIQHNDTSPKRLFVTLSISDTYHKQRSAKKECDIMLIVIMLSAVMLTAIMLSAIMLSAIMLRIVMLSVSAPEDYLWSVVPLWPNVM